MLDQVLDLARRKDARADALLRDVTVLSLSFEAGRLKGSALSQEAGLNLRVIVNGRVGVAGTTDLTGPDDVVRRAFASAAEGESLDLELPATSKLPDSPRWAARWSSGSSGPAGRSRPASSGTSRPHGSPIRRGSRSSSARAR